MTEISAATVKALRQRSGAPMMDCKKALVDSHGDLEQAVIALRKKGLASALKKVGRATAQGLIAQAFTDNRQRGVMLEINSETDFVANNALFQKFVADVATHALTWSISGPASPLEAFAEQDVGDGRSLGQRLSELIAQIGENLSLNKITALEVSAGCIGGYVHNSVAPGLGRQGALVALESTAVTAPVQELATKLAMHVTAAKPRFVSIAHVDEDTLKTERDIALDQAKAANKPPAIIEKIVEGRLQKYFAEHVLTEQTYIMDDSLTVKDAIAATSQDGLLKIRDMALFVLGSHV